MFTSEEMIVPRSTFMDWNYIRTLMPEFITHFREPDETTPATIPGNNSDDICDLFAEAVTVHELYTRSIESQAEAYEEYLIIIAHHSTQSRNKTVPVVTPLQRLRG